MSATASITLRRAGGSLIATIPKQVVDAERLRPGDRLVATFRRRREILDELIGSVPEVGPWDRSWTRGRDRY